MHRHVYLKPDKDTCSEIDNVYQLQSIQEVTDKDDYMGQQPNIQEFVTHADVSSRAKTYDKLYIV